MDGLSDDDVNDSMMYEYLDSLAGGLEILGSVYNLQQIDVRHSLVTLENCAKLVSTSCSLDCKLGR